jgi:hypothetical protein
MPVVSVIMVTPNSRSGGALRSQVGAKTETVMIVNSAMVKNHVRPGRVKPRRFETQPLD